MEVKEQKIIFYTTQSGLRPFMEWSESLKDRGALQRIFARLARIRSGNFGDAKSVGEGVVELRIMYGPGYRVYFGRDGVDLIVLLCGGDKSSQSDDITEAKVHWSDYKRRKEND